MIDARYLIDYASDAAFAIDGSCRIVAWNYRARRLLGYTRREVIGERCSDVLQAVLPDGEPLSDTFKANRRPIFKAWPK